MHWKHGHRHDSTIFWHGSKFGCYTYIDALKRLSATAVKLHVWNLLVHQKLCFEINLSFFIILKWFYKHQELTLSFWTSLHSEENFLPPTGIYEISHFDEPHNFCNFCHLALVLQVHKSIYSFSRHMNFLYHASFAWKNTCDTCVQNPDHCKLNVTLCAFRLNIISSFVYFSVCCLTAVLYWRNRKVEFLKATGSFCPI